jgi:UDP-N-acetylglucosamine 1-carboxyvinyltransferase
MSTLTIKGPVQLNGEVEVRGAKNASLPTIIASAVGPGPVTLDNVPTDQMDIAVAVEALRHVGCKVEISEGKVELASADITTTSLPPEISGRFRYSLLFLGLCTGKCGYAKITMPGGCNLGDRKFDLHLEGLRQLGAKVETKDNVIEVTADRLVGTDIDFYLPTTSGTENIMIAACFAEGRTRIFNANTRPEVADLGKMLNSMGAKVGEKPSGRSGRRFQAERLSTPGNGRMG